MQLSKSLLLISAMSAGSVLASPTHVHRHQQFHESKRGVGTVVTAEIDGKEVSWVNTYDGSSDASSSAAAAAPATSATAAAAPAASPSASAAASSSDSSSSDSSDATAFCKRATAGEIAYAGNTGDCGYGTNILQVASSVIDSFDYVLEFVNSASGQVACQCGNKVGADGGVNGFFGDGVTQFTLATGASQHVAFDTNTQGECMCAEGDSVPQSSVGQALGAWVEFSFGDSANSGWSGLDVSIIAAQAAGSSFPSVAACVAGSCSSVNSDGTTSNAYDSSNVNADGVGLNLVPGNISGQVTIS